MEDQQPAAGDLTDEARKDSAPEDSRADSETVEAAAPVTKTEAAMDDSPQDGDAEPDGEEAGTESAESETAEAKTAEAETAKPGKPAKRAKGVKPGKSAKPAKAAKQAKAAKPKKKGKPGRLAAVVVALVAALFVGSSAFAAAMVQPYLAEQAIIEVKVEVARAAANAITTLWSYTPENMDTLADRAGRYLTGDFGAQYRKFVEEKVVGPNKQLKITNSTEVTGVAVESLDGPNATVIVYTNTTATTPLKKNIPSLQYLSYRMSMKREGDRWLVTRMTTITSLDVTPQL